MASDLQLITLTNTDKRFYPVIGPFLGRREVHRAVGGVIYDDDGKTWIVARSGHKVAGFIAYRGQHGMITAESCYIARRDRDGDEDPAVREALLDALIQATAPSPITTMVPKAVAGIYTERRFTELPQKSTTNFVRLVRSPA